MKKKNCSPLAKRIVLSTLLGTAFGGLCFLGFTSNPDVPSEMQQYMSWSWSNPMMWDIIVNRATIGFFVGVMGFITLHPLFGFKIPVFLRGFKVGVIISLTLALGATMGNNPEPAKTFWILTIAGGIIGMIIDLIVTKVAGDGKVLYEK